MPPSEGHNTSQITDSMLGPAPAPPIDTDAMAKMRPKSRPLVWLLAAAVAVGITAAVIATSKPRPSDDALAGTPAATGAPLGTQSPATTPPATASAAAADLASSVRTVKVESEPAGASVTEGGAEVCSATPCEVIWKGDAGKGEHKLQLNKKGFKTTKLTVAESDTKVSSKLDAVAVYVPTGPRPPPPATDPSGGKRKPNPYGD
jgi:hypothetical protein